MVEPNGNLERAMETWRQGRASVEEIRAMSLELGKKQYPPGIPILFELLDHEDWAVRYYAILGLAFDFHHTPAANRLIAIMVEDADEDCRGSAAGGLGNLCAGSKDRRVLEALSQAALHDPDEYVRSSAYTSMQIVDGLSRDEVLKLLRSDDLSVDKDRVMSILAAASGNSNLD